MTFFLQKVKIFAIGALGYTILEVLFRGYTHWSMTITGGVCFLFLYQMSGRDEKAPLWQKCLKGAVIITAIEYMVGCIVNLWLGWNVWDYSSYPFNFLGQVCLAFTLLWFMLCIPLFYSVRFLRNTRFSRFSR